MLCKTLNIVYKFNFKTFIYMYYQNILFLNASFFSKIWRFKILVILFPFFKILKQTTRSVSNKNSKMVIVRARYHLLCLRCFIFLSSVNYAILLHELLFKITFQDTHKLIQLFIFSPNFSKTSFIERCLWCQCFVPPLLAAIEFRLLPMS